jgi:hypothetical protein
MSSLVVWRDNLVNLYNKYLLFLTEDTSKQADNVCGNRSGLGPEDGHVSEAGHALWMLGKARVTVLVSAVFLQWQLSDCGAGHWAADLGDR